MEERSCIELHLNGFHEVWARSATPDAQRLEQGHTIFFFFPFLQLSCILLPLSMNWHCLSNNWLKKKKKKLCQIKGSSASISQLITGFSTCGCFFNSKTKWNCQIRRYKVDPQIYNIKNRKAEEMAYECNLKSGDPVGRRRMGSMESSEDHDRLWVISQKKVISVAPKVANQESSNCSLQCFI